ncbi:MULTISPECIES: DMT family transporter [Kordiimonas]|jgi:O-acetylserine/cysteine efflux transporter|uniref:DMT family transporter n=1 Tax=Kordiimonas TaxID=288021 RepID=UPI00257A0315|nr:DMT family transporter [Kordiimonas sp. UBA4487]
MRTRDILLVILVTLVWGLNFIAVKWAVEDLPPLVANATRFIVVVVVLLPFLKIVPGRMKDLAIAAVSLGVIHFGAVFMGMQLAGGVGAVAIASQLNVPFSTILAIIVLHETVGWKRVVGIALSFAGVLVLGFDPNVFAYWDALLIIVFAAFMYSVSAVLMRRLKEVRAVTTQAWVGVAGILGSAVLSSIFETGQFEALANTGTKAWIAVVYTGIGASVIGHGGANYLLRRYEVSVVSPYFLMMPVFAVGGGILILGEEFTWRMAVGAALTLLGVMVVTLRNSARAKSLAVAEIKPATEEAKG